MEVAVGLLAAGVVASRGHCGDGVLLFVDAGEAPLRVGAGRVLLRGQAQQGQAVGDVLVGAGTQHEGGHPRWLPSVFQQRTEGAGGQEARPARHGDQAGVAGGAVQRRAGWGGFQVLGEPRFEQTGCAPVSDGRRGDVKADDGYGVRTAARRVVPAVRLDQFGGRQAGYLR